MSNLRFIVPVFCLFCACSSISTARAEFAPPRLFNVFPMGGKTGTEFEVETAGQILEEPRALFFSHAGITAQWLKPADVPLKAGEKPKPPDPNKPHKFKVKIAADVPPGDYEVRFVGKAGISNPRFFVVSDYDEAEEKEPNNTRKEANRIALNTTVNGRISPPEDIDWFVFAAKKGQRVLIECRAWRIDSRLDGFMWLYDGEGKQLAISQDEDIRDEKRDPFIDVEIPADGDYFVKLCDFTYNGSNDHFYRLSIGMQPYIDYIIPSSVPPGSGTTVTIFGRNLPKGEPAGVNIKGRPLEKITRQVEAPAAGKEGEAPGLHFNGLIRPWSSLLDGFELRVKSEAGSSNGKLLRISAMPQVLQTPGNTEIAKAQKLPVPCVVSGQFSRETPDFYTFSAKKGEKFSIDVFSNRIHSPADPDMEILKPDGGNLATVQDWDENIGQLRFTSNTRDISHMFTAPGNADYTLRLEHLFRQAQGGPQYIYQLEIQKDPQPDFRLICSPPDEIRVDSHLLYQGGRQRMDILVWRMHGHDEPITVEARNLPAGVSADPFVIGKGVKWGTLVLSAAPDAAMGEAAIEIVGTSVVNGKPLLRQALGGVIVWDTVNTPALSRVTQNIVIAVREKVPFALSATPAEITVKKGDSFDITVTLKRREDMTNAVQLTGAGYQLPPNMTIPVKNIDSGQNEGKLSISTEKIPEGTFSFMINGDGQVPVDKTKNVRCVYPSNVIKLIVESKTAPTVAPAEKDKKK